MSAKQMFVLMGVVPDVLFPLLIVLAAGIGMTRWRRMTQVLSITALALLIFGAVFLRSIVDVQLSNRIPDAIVYSFQPYATPAILYSSSIGGVGAFLALVLCGPFTQLDVVHDPRGCGNHQRIGGAGRL